MRVTNTPQWSCVQCHETNVDPWGTTPWNKTCGACHTGATAQHTTKAAMHTSSRVACSGAGCHTITDIGALHSTASTTEIGRAHV